MGFGKFNRGLFRGRKRIEKMAERQQSAARELEEMNRQKLVLDEGRGNVIGQEGPMMGK